MSGPQQEMLEALVGAEPTKGALRRDWKLLPRMLPYLRPYRKMAALSIVITVALAVLALAEPWPLAFVIDSVLGEKEPPGWVTGIFGEGTGGLIALAVGATLLLTALSGAFTVVNEYLSTSVDQRMVLDLRSEMFQHAQRLSLAFHDDERMGVLMYRINNQASALGQIIVGLPVLAQSVLTIAGMGYIAFRIDPLLALIGLAVVPFVFYSTTFYADRIEPRLYRVRGMEAMNLAIVHEAMAMLRVVLAFGHERKEHARFWQQGRETVDARIDLTVRQTVFRLAVQLITAAGTAAVIGVGAYQALKGRITPGELLVILSYMAAVYKPLEDLANTLAAFQQWFISLRLSFDLLDHEPDVREREGARPLGRSRGELELEHVTFGYPNRADVLKDVSLRIPAGGAVAIVGPTGAGKSTLVSLLPRFYDPAQGRILLDETDTRDVTLESLRAQFSIVLQEPLLFSTSILDNIRYGKPDATLEEVQDAARKANVHDFIAGLPKGYETVLGERGAKISGGERQRIAVARAFLRDAPILILDEPTSSIDSRTEAVIIDALERLMEGRTTIMIAHRLSTIRSVDQILVVSDGEIVQRGTHEELMAEPGLYRELWEAQTRKDPDDDDAPPAPAPDPDPDPQSPGARPGVTRLPQAARGHRPGAGAGTESRSPVRPATSLPRQKIVLLGMLTKIPVGGAAWLVGHYAEGFERLGYEVYYVETHARTPSMFMTHPEDDGDGKAAQYIKGIAERFGLGDRWAYQGLQGSAPTYGMSPARLARLYKDAALIINMHGGTLPLPEHAATDRLVFLGTDPVQVELEVHDRDRRALDFLDQHAAFFTWGLNFGNPDCRLPWASPYPFVPSPPPVLLDRWETDADPTGPFTTIGNWRQHAREVTFEGTVYRWSKHQQFKKILDLPMRTLTPMELALSSYEDHDRLVLAEHGWRVRPAMEVSTDLDRYRAYIQGSAGEVSAAKEQNVHFRSGWFSERSATYLAAGRPVIVQDTGFGSALPTGEGLFGFHDLESAAEAVATVNADPARARRAAREIAREFLGHDVVLGDMLEHVGLRPTRHGRPSRLSPAPAQYPPDLSLDVVSRRPLALPEATRRHVLQRPVPSVSAPVAPPVASIVMPVLDNLACTRMALESVLANTDEPPYEVVVVDNGSQDETRRYLETLAARNRHVRVLRNEHNEGFARACNAGMAASAGEIVVLLNNDTVVPRGWLSGLTRRLDDPNVGIVGPATNRCGGGAQIPTRYRSYGEMLAFAEQRRQDGAHAEPFDIEVVEMFCAALRRDVVTEVGPLDERFEIGMFEDDDYVMRVRKAGYRVVCADELFVHHFGEASLGALAADGRYGELFHANRRRFEEKWQTTWTGHGRRNDPDYAAMTRRVQDAVREHVPPGATVVVASRGDEALVGLEGRDAWHFPQRDDGAYAGHHPADDAEAIAELERLRDRGARYLVLPASSLWWLDHYDGFRRHLGRYPRSTEDPSTAVIFRLDQKLPEPDAAEASA